MLENAYLIGWLRARKHSVEGAANNIRKLMDWRNETRMDTILDEHEPWDSLFPYVAYRADGIAKDGTPVLEPVIGKWDIRKLVLAGKGKLYTQFHARIFEHINNKSRQIAQQNPDVYGFHLIADVTGYSPRKLACAACIPFQIQIIKNLEAYYTKDIQLFYILNAPRIFSTFFAIIKPFFSEHDRERIRLGGLNQAEWQADLFQVIPKDQLLPSLGGTKPWLVSGAAGY